MHQQLLKEHLTALSECRQCSGMCSAPVTGLPVKSRIMLVGQAPGDKEPLARKPFAWTAGRTLFRWFATSCGIDEQTFRSRIYMTAVCRCFPGKKASGGDRVPNAGEIARCGQWLRAEVSLLEPQLVIPVGRLAIAQFCEYRSLDQHVGDQFRGTLAARQFDVIPLPHPSGASPWPRVEPGKTLLGKALAAISEHPSMRAICTAALSTGNLP